MSFFERCDEWAEYYLQFHRAPQIQILTLFTW